VTIPFVDLAALIGPSRAVYVAAFERVLDSGGFIGGPAVTTFEAAFASYCGAPHAVAVRTGTDALVLALRALGVGPGDEVITAANSFFATAEAISHAGATPVLADADDHTLLLDPADAARRVTRRTRCIIPVHLFGQIADMAPLRALAAANRLHVVEDSAQAHGATRLGPGGDVWRAGSIAEVAAFSFYPTKNLGAIGDGGAVVTNDEKVAERARLLREYGWKARYISDIPGGNSRLDELQAAILRVKLPFLDRDNDARRRIAGEYRAALAGTELELPEERSGTRHVYHLFVVQSGRREALEKSFRDRDIQAAIHYPMPVHLQPAYKGRIRSATPLTVTENMTPRILSLPMYPELTAAEVARVVEAVRAAG
jgi:dTDP-4-amino-4,6-dideoxygalactose transaminase